MNGEIVKNWSDQELLDFLLKNKPASAAERATDIIKSSGRGLADFAIGTAAFPGDVQSMAEIGASTISGMPPERLRDLSSPTARWPTSQQVQGAVEQWTGPLYQPQTTEGKYARSISSFLPAAGPGAVATLPGRAFRLGAVPGVTSEFTGQALEGTPYETAGRVGTALVSPSVAGRAITPLPVSSQRQRYIDILDKEGVTLTAGQRTGREPLKYTESVLGNLPFAGSRAAEITGRQGGEFTGAALKRIGEDAKEATPEVINRARARIGNVFETTTKNLPVTFDKKFGDGLVKLRQDLFNERLPDDVTNRLAARMDEIISGFETKKTGQVQMTGKTYHGLTQYEAPLQALIDEGGRAGYYAKRLRSLLDETVERTAHAKGTKEGTGRRQAWADFLEARQQWRDMLAIERAAAAPGEAAAQGVLSPAQMRTALTGQDRSGYARGRGDLNELTHAGQAVMTPLPQSGTGPRIYAYSLPTSLGATVGGVASGNPMFTAAGLGAIAAPPLIGRALMSSPAQAWLGAPGPVRRTLGAIPSDQERLARLLAAAQATYPARRAAE